MSQDGDCSDDEPETVVEAHLTDAQLLELRASHPAGCVCGACDDERSEAGGFGVAQ